MATLQNIRNRSGLLLAVIGIAMLAFILTDALNSIGPNTNRSGIVGEVLGQDILIQKFEQKVNEGIENWKSQNQNTILDQNTLSQIRDQIWDQYVRELVLENEFQELGIDISDDEFFELLQGVNVHSEISKVPSFQDPTTGAFDRTRVLGYLKQIDQDETGEARTRWVGFQKYLMGLIKTSKYNSLIEKAMFTTNTEAKNELISTTQNATFNYVAIPYSSIQDTNISVSDKELEDYYSEHKSEYEQEASKDVDFVVYSVIPSVEDEVKTKSEIADLVDDFGNYDDYESMTRRNSDNTASRFSYSTEEGLQDENWRELFNAKKGTVIGPYLNTPGVYRIAKLVEVEYRPDSVEARHILIKPNQTMNIDSVDARINAIKAQVESGANFSILAQQNSEDQGSAIKGGDLGWFEEGVMVDEFNQACFTSKRGELSVVRSQFGVHLIEVTQTSSLVKKVKIAYIDRNVEPSTETFNAYYSQAARFAGKLLNEGVSFDTLIKANNLVKRTEKKVTANKNAIGGVPNSREMVRWVNTAEVGSVNEAPFEFGNLYVVAYITNEYLEGVSDLEDIEEQIKALVIREKKGAIISESISGTDLSSIASTYTTTVVDAKKATFGNLSVQGIGYEPELVGSIFASKIGNISSPVIGKNAVYVFETTAFDEETSNENFSQQKLKLERQAASSSSRISYDALKKAANVQDNRSDFY